VTGKFPQRGKAAKPLEIPANRTDPVHARAIERSLELAAEREGDLTPRVYARLFEQKPEMETLFARDTNDLIKGEMLMRVFEAVLDFVGERRYADHLISAEVITHEGYEVPREVFATFFGIVAAVVRESCGPEWTAEMNRAWQGLLDDLAHYVKQPLAASS
jgi:hemoglobin-like flavoprotein